MRSDQVKKYNRFCRRVAKELSSKIHKTPGETLVDNIQAALGKMTPKKKKMLQLITSDLYPWIYVLRNIIEPVESGDWMADWMAESDDAESDHAKPDDAKPDNVFVKSDE